MESALKYLEILYDILYNNYLLNYKKSKSKSIIILFLDMNSNNRFRLLSQSSLDILSVPPLELNWLKNNNLVRDIDEINKITLTGKGVYIEEKRRIQINEEVLIDCIDDEFFNIFSNVDSELIDKEKVILLSMIAARSFSEKSSVDLKKSDKANEIWLEIITKSYELLKRVGAIKNLSVDRLIGEEGKKGNESTVSYIFRRTDNLPKLTRKIFTHNGKQKYYLDLFVDNKIKEVGISFLLKKILTKVNITNEVVNEVYSFFREIAHTKDKHLFNMNDHIFNKFEYDTILKNILLTL